MVANALELMDMATMLMMVVLETVETIMELAMAVLQVNDDDVKKRKKLFLG